MNFDHITNWKLLSGSHEFPGPDGGTCINEAAIIAAGFTYKKVISADDCPPCFSRPVSTALIYLNDKMPDDQRQILLPFVFKLAGSADTEEVETQRAEFLLIGMFRDVISLSFRGWRDDLAAQFEAVQTLEQAKAACSNLDFALNLDLAFARALARALNLDFNLALIRKRFAAMANLIDGALKIGNQADPLDGALVCQRLDAAKRLVIAE